MPNDGQDPSAPPDSAERLALVLDTIHILAEHARALHLTGADALLVTLLALLLAQNANQRDAS